MTREEAIKAFHGATPNPSSFADAAWIDRFVALGMLNLDEPKSAVDKTYEILNGKNLAYSAAGRMNVYVLGPGDIRAIIDTLATHGLKIVEK